MTIALLIDADNVRAVHYPEILRHAQELGAVPIRRAYFAGNGGDWAQVPGLRFGTAGEGKNAADFLLTIDAMELALLGKAERFVIASSDGDFAHLALRLREYGLEVRGIGKPDASARFREACSGFQALQVAAEPLQLESPSKTSADVPVLSPVDQKACELLRANGGRMKVSLLGAKLGQSGIKLDALTGRNWWTHLDSNSDLFDLDPRGSDAMVRLKPHS